MKNTSFTSIGLTRMLRACHYSVEGIRAAWKHEAAFRQESVLVIAALVLMGVLPVPFTQSWVLLASALLVWAVELLNSALEAIVDLASPDVHSLAKRAKDCGSAAVAMTLLILALAWGSILLPLIL